MYFLIEATVALFVSFLINLFVVAVFGQAFYQQTNQAAVRDTSSHRSTPHARVPRRLCGGTPGNAVKPFDSPPYTLGTGRGGSLRLWPLAGTSFLTPLGRHSFPQAGSLRRSEPHQGPQGTEVRERCRLGDPAFQLHQEGWAVFAQQTAGRACWEEGLPEHDCGVATGTQSFSSLSLLS